MLAPETNPQIEQMLTNGDVVGEIRRSIEVDVTENDATRAQLKSLGLTTERDYDDLVRRLHEARVFYRERVLRPWDEIRDAVGRTESLARNLRFEGPQGVLLLIDPYAGANWGHPCWIATFDIDQRKIRQILNDFPPVETADRRLVPILTRETGE